MKRRAPTIWAAVVGLGVLGVASKDRSHVRHEKPQVTSAEADPAKDSSPEEGDDTNSAPAELTALAPAPSAPPSGSASRFHTMPDGSPVPPLSSSAPERVKLGVALFRYKGAQGSSDSTRSKDAARALAEEAAKLAKDDFAAAVKKGDHGSSENIGWLKQRILERAVEYSVFSLDKGAVSSTPIDTPKGFWVAKRLR